MNSINSTSSIQQPPPPPPRSSGSNDSLTDEQQKLLSETLSDYDAENLTADDAASIIEALSEAGITPGAGLETAMSDLGFDAKSIGELGGAQSGSGSRSESGDIPPPPPPPQQSTEEITSMVDYLTELMEEKLAESQSSELSEDDKSSIMAALSEKFNIQDGNSIINTTV